MKILLIGNSGFIGTYLSKKLLSSGHEVVGMDINPPKDEKSVSDFHLGDVTNLQDIIKASFGVEAIINLAAKHHDFGVSRDEFFKVNVQGTKNALDCATKYGIKKFIFYSSVAIYGDVKTFSTEDTLPAPVNDYGRSKLEAEKLINVWAYEDSTRQAVIIRPTVVFGANNYANMYNLIDKIYRKRFIFVGEGKNIKSVAYVENLVDATIFLIQKFKTGLEIYNYSDYPQMTSQEISIIISHYLNRNIPNLKFPLNAAIVLASVFDLTAKFTGYNFPITAARIKKFNTSTYHKSEKIRALGFEPKIELSDGFRRMAEWYLINLHKKKCILSQSSED